MGTSKGNHRHAKRSNSSTGNALYRVLIDVVSRKYGIPEAEARRILEVSFQNREKLNVFLKNEPRWPDEHAPDLLRYADPVIREFEESDLVNDLVDRTDFNPVVAFRTFLDSYATKLGCEYDTRALSRLLIEAVHRENPDYSRAKVRKIIKDLVDLPISEFFEKPRLSKKLDKIPRNVVAFASNLRVETGAKNAVDLNASRVRLTRGQWEEITEEVRKQLRKEGWSEALISTTVSREALENAVRSYDRSQRSKRRPSKPALRVRNSNHRTHR
jgi:hypothetical protein